MLSVAHTVLMKSTMALDKHLTSQEATLIRGAELDREATRIRAALALTPAAIDARAEAAWAAAMDALKNGR